MTNVIDPVFPCSRDCVRDHFDHYVRVVNDVVKHYRQLLDNKSGLTYAIKCRYLDRTKYRVNVKVQYKNAMHKKTHYFIDDCKLNVKQFIENLGVIDKIILPMYYMHERKESHNTNYKVEPCLYHGMKRSPLMLMELARHEIRSTIIKCKPHCKMLLSDDDDGYDRSIIMPLNQQVDTLPLPTLMKQFVNYNVNLEDSPYNFYYKDPFDIYPRVKCLCKYFYKEFGLSGVLL